MITFRSIAMATTILAGFAISAFDAAQAKGPSISVGGISNFSSMRVDFNRIGGPNRALSRNDVRVVPVDLTKPDKGTTKKDAARKGVNTARVSNPKPARGGRGKEEVSTPKVRIPAHLEEIFHLTNGNLDDLSQLANLADWIRNGPLRVPNPLFPSKGDEPFAIPEELGGGIPGRDGQGDKNADRYWVINGWFGHRGAPQPFPNPSGKASNNAGEVTIYPDGSMRVLFMRPNGRDYTVTDYGPFRLGRDGTAAREETHTTMTDGHVRPHATRTMRYDLTDPTVNGGFKDDGPRFYAEPGRRDPDAPRNSTGGENTDQIIPAADEDTSGGENPPDSQPVGEGTSDPGSTGWCSPTGGCVTGSVVQGPRINPTADNSMPEMRSQLPSWATDPCPDCTARGGGGGRTGYVPQNEGAGDEGGRGGRTSI